MNEAPSFPAKEFHYYMAGLHDADAEQLASMAAIIEQEHRLQARPGMLAGLDKAAEDRAGLRQFVDRPPPTDIALTADEAPLPISAENTRERARQYDKAIRAAKDRKLAEIRPYYELRVLTGRVALQVHSSYIADRISLEVTPRREIAHPTATVRHAITDLHGPAQNRVLWDRLMAHNAIPTDRLYEQRFKRALLVSIASYAVLQHETAVH